VRAISLLIVLVVAKATTLLLLRDGVAWSPWAPVAYFWQDVLVALIFFLFDSLVRRPAVAWAIYVVVVAYAAINVPIAGSLSSPLTWTLMRAARGPLADSVVHHVTPLNLLGFALPLAAGAIAPLWLTRLNLVLRWPWIAVAIGFVALGPLAASTVDTRGLQRNSIGALVSTSVSRLPAVQSSEPWRASPFGGKPEEDLGLGRYLGAAKGRNVVLVVLESTAARHLGVYGARQDPMPGLTDLARSAIVFERAYAVYPESIKGLFATLCARYPAFDTAPEVYADVPCASLPGQLDAAGYQTALFHSGRFEYLGMRSVVENRGFEVLEDAGVIGGNVRSSFGVDEHATVQRMIAWIDGRAAGSPFFITYLPVAGHHPYATSRPGPFDGDSDFTRYLNALHEGDEALTMFIRALQARGLDRETLFVIFGDHGEAFGEHPGNFAHTLFIYEENVRVPFLILAPGALAPARVGRLTSVIDTAPTILELLALPVPPEYEGVSMLDPRQTMALFYTDYSLGWLGLADGCWKYTLEIDADRSYLFDVCQDPNEQRDRAHEQPDRVAAYRDRVRKWASAQKASVTADAAR
jgi:phosphoglycerol transferase MdoB-like AlkP superfamily enzyme